MILDMTVPGGRDIIPVMKFQPTDRLCISADVLSQEVNSETVLLDLDGESYFSLNEVGTRIWQLLNGGPAFAGLLEALSGEYDVDPAQLEDEVDALLRQLAEAGLVSVKHA